MKKCSVSQQWLLTKCLSVCIESIQNKCPAFELKVFFFYFRCETHATIRLTPIYVYIHVLHTMSFFNDFVLYCIVACEMILFVYNVLVHSMKFLYINSPNKWRSMIIKIVTTIFNNNNNSFICFQLMWMIAAQCECMDNNNINMFEVLSFPFSIIYLFIFSIYLSSSTQVF